MSYELFRLAWQTYNCFYPNFQTINLLTDTFCWKKYKKHVRKCIIHIYIYYSHARYRIVGNIIYSANDVYKRQTKSDHEVYKRQTKKWSRRQVYGHQITDKMCEKHTKWKQFFIWITQRLNAIFNILNKMNYIHLFKKTTYTL